jgi:hypothetical protein
LQYIPPEFNNFEGNEKTNMQIKLQGNTNKLRIQKDTTTRRRITLEKIETTNNHKYVGKNKRTLTISLNH